MPVELIKYAFSAGVFSRSLHGRSDLEKYDLGLAEGENFFIDYRGGATSRSGTELAEQIGGVDLEAIRFFNFRFNRLLSNNYLLVFTPEKLRFIQDGAYVLEAAKTITLIAGNTVTSAAHGYSVGDFVQISARTYVIGAVTTNTFTTLDFAGAAETPAGTEVQRVYTISTPYTADMLPGLQFRQRRDFVRITTLDYGPMDLTRSAHTSWALAAYDRGGASISAPTGLSASASASGTASINWTVTAVDHNDRETTLSTIARLDSIVNYANDPGSVKFSWTAVAGAKYYNVYRSLVFPIVAQNSAGQQLGFIGRSYGTSFTDVNVSPNFVLTPPVIYNPFDVGQIQYIEVTNAGSGYTSNPTVTITDPDGSGFVGLAIRSSSNTIEAVMVLDPGSGYTAPVVSFSGGGGASAAATAVLGVEEGLNPAVSIFYGQRMWMMGTTATPMTLYSGRSDDIFSFAHGQYATAADPYELDLEAPELTPIRFAEQLTDNMFVFTDSGVYQVAPSERGYASTQRTMNGTGKVRPIPINTEMIFALPDGSGVLAIRPGQVPNSYVDADLAIFSGDFFSPEQEIISWAFARTPFRILWAALANGRMLSFTYVPEHNVYAWSSHSTAGSVLEIANVLESGVDVPYIAVRRDTGTFIERMKYRNFDTVEDIWSVDCGLSTALVNPAADVTVVDGAEGFWTVTASTAIFSSGDVGKHFRAGGGMGVVTSYTSTTQITVEAVIDIEDRKPQSDLYPEFLEGDWSLTEPITSVSGLKHLAGQTVQVLADGSYFGDYTVSAGGTITLDVAASKIIVGLGFDGELTTLPVVASDQAIDSRRKRPLGVALRLEKSRGLRYGVDSAIYDLPDRTDERYGEPTRFQSGLRSASLRADWNTAGQLTVQKRGPVAISLLGYILDIEVGDDPQ